MSKPGNRITDLVYLVQVKRTKRTMVGFVCVSHIFALFRHFPDRGGSVDPVSKLTSRLMVPGALRLGTRWNPGQIVHL